MSAGRGTLTLNFHRVCCVITLRFFFGDRMILDANRRPNHPDLWTTPLGGI